MTGNAVNEIWSKPNIGAVATLVAASDKIYSCCYREECLSVLALDAATGDEMFSTRVINHGIREIDAVNGYSIDALIHQGGLLFLWLRKDQDEKYGFICAIEANTGKVMWGLHLTNLTGGFTVCAT